MDIPLETYQQHLSQLSLKDEHRLSVALASLIKRRGKNLPFEKELAAFEKEFNIALDLMIARHKNLPQVCFSDDLPISQKREVIADAISENPVIILAGETGSGKTTQIPKICLTLSRGLRGKIGHTQPRRIAARAVATRIAQELNTAPGATVGYQVRFEDHTSENTLIKLMTDGVLLAEINSDPLLLNYDTLIIDEAHERSLNIDFLLGYLKKLLPKRPDLKVIVTSATIDLDRFSQYFDNAPIIEVSGRTYDVQTTYRPWMGEYEDIYDAIVGTLGDILQNRKRGDVLVFLSGEREIREASSAIKKANFRHLDILPLYSRLSIVEQNKIFHAHKGQRVVLATNVAETSITVPGIKYVIDPGYARVSRYSVRTKVQCLPIEAISQASANQRKGRCGRVSEGVCYRLYDEEDFYNRPAFTDAEITRTNLAAVILQMLHMNIGDIRDFPFIDRPEKKFINDGYKLLEEIGAVASTGKVTPKARLLNQLPIDPRLAAVIVEASQLGCLNEVLIIVAALSIQDPRERPADKQQAADEKHRRFSDENSDFVAYVNLWNYFERQRQEKTQSQLRKLCQREFINFMRMRDWRELHRQLKLAIKKLGYKENRKPASYETLHKALICGYLSQIGNKDQEKNSREYLGTRQKKFIIFPGSSQAKKKSKWIMVAQFIETRQLFAHCVAKIEPEWVLDYSDHLAKKHYYEPHYDTKLGQVRAFVRTTLLGLVLQEKKRVSYHKIDAKNAREIFIREALVEGKYRGKGTFFSANQKLVEEIQILEAKSRRRDIMADEEAIMNFYRDVVPEHIVNLSGFEYWRKTIETEQASLLHIRREQLMLHSAEQVSLQQFPDELVAGDCTLAVSYCFEPGKDNDGVNVTVPVELLHEIHGNILEWMVPGILRDKCIALVKGLPKNLRKNFVPVPETVDKVLPRLKVSNIRLTEALGDALGHISQTAINSEDWNEAALDKFYKINVLVVDDNDKVIDRSRDIEELRKKYKVRVQNTLSEIGGSIERQDITRWDFGTLSEDVILSRGNMKIKAYPALVDSKGQLDLKILDNPAQARYESSHGVVRLAAIECVSTVKYLKKSVMKGKDLGLAVLNIGSRACVVEDIILAAIRRAVFENETLPENDTQFQEMVAKGKSSIAEYAHSYEKLMVDLLSDLININKQIKSSRNPLIVAIAVGDISNQLNGLVYKGFLSKTPWRWLQHYPRYLSAVKMRLEKISQNPDRDEKSACEIKSLWIEHEDRLLKEGYWGYFQNPAWQEYRWMIEELRVSLFAQSLKTLMPVSSKRLKKQWGSSL